MEIISDLSEEAAEVESIDEESKHVDKADKLIAGYESKNPLDRAKPPLPPIRASDLDGPD